MFKVRLHLGSSERNPANDLCQPLLPQPLLEQAPKTKTPQIPLTPVVYSSVEQMFDFDHFSQGT